MKWATGGKRTRIIACAGGVILILLGGLAVLMYGSKHTLTCARDAGGAVNCIQSKTWFGLFPLAKEQVFAPVEAASVELDCRTDSSQDVPVYECFYNKVRISGAGESSLLSMPFNETTAADAGDRINAYIAAPQAANLVIDSFSSFEVVLGFVFVALPCFALGILLLVGQRAVQK